ncbi:RcnB family protein [Sphingomonas sp.]|jgi:Ni/Co efflux regulator RcnB|uniref:RcnB family protein n=1 Tax=Sphingomonas sp. TaxID=28214 RepID=UPI002ED7D9AE
MRTLLIAGTAMVALIGADAASAGERMVQRGPGVQPRSAMPVTQHRAARPITHQRAPRWGSKVGGRWWGGVNAPGGWNAYRRPVRGWAVPVYWNTPRFYVSDWANYGLAQPPYGYNWVRYYDDAVLIDSRGSVFDTTQDVDWDRQDRYADVGDYGYDDDRVYAGDARDYDGRDFDRRDDDRRRDTRYERGDNGLGGAAIGAVAGGVAGNVIAGRGNRLGGTLIGAGVGAAAGYVIDKNEDRGPAYRGPAYRGGDYRDPPAPPPRVGYGAGYPQPGYGPGHAPPRAYPPAPMAGGNHWVSPDGGTTVVTSGGGYGGSYTTVTVQTAPVVTTTTTEIYEDHVTWSRPIAKKKVWKPRRKTVCRCS